MTRSTDPSSDDTPPKRDPAAVLAPDLDGFLETCWRELVLAVPDTKHGFHWPVAATIGLDGAPQARVVVLRGALPDDGELRFHTDRRSPKIAELERDARLAMTFHDSRRKLQIRATGRAVVARDDAIADACWSSVGTGSQRCYLAPSAPSAPVDGAAPSPNLPSHLVGRIPEPDEVAAGRARFAVVRLLVEQFDALALSPHGHRRARFALGAGSGSTTTWLEP